MPKMEPEPDFAIIQSVRSLSEDSQQQQHESNGNGQHNHDHASSMDCEEVSVEEYDYDNYGYNNDEDESDLEELVAVPESDFVNENDPLGEQMPAPPQTSEFIGNPAIQYPNRYGNRGSLLKTFKCWDCPAVQYTRDKYQTHISLHVGQRRLRCPNCSYSCDNNGVLQRHIHCHTAEYLQNISFSASGSSSSFATSTTLSSSARPSSTPRRKQCRLKCRQHAKCPATFLTVDDRRKHELLHTLPEAKFHCDICSYKANRPNLIENHKQKHIDVSRSLIELQRENNDQDFLHHPQHNDIARRRSHSSFNHSCSICPSTFSKPGDLLRHMRRHEDKSSPYKCRHCTYAVFRPDLMRRHELLHLNGSKIKVNQHQLPNANGAQMGMGRTIEARMYKCTAFNCPQTFSKEGFMKRHLVESHGRQSQYMCTKCDYGANSLEAKHRHQKSHLVQERSISKRSGGQIHPSLVYNRKLVSRNKMGSMKINKNYTKPERHRANPLKDGLLTPEECELVRSGNSSFEYQTHGISANGDRTAWNYRCWHCPKAFKTYVLWSHHQAGTHGTMKYIHEWYYCQLCEFKTFRRTALGRHMKTHARKMMSLVDGGCGYSPNPEPKQMKDTRPMQEKFVNQNQNGQMKAETKSEPNNLYHSVNLKTEKAEPTPSSRRLSLISPMKNDILKPFIKTGTGTAYLISSVTINNVMGIKDKVIDSFTSRLYGMHGNSDAKKTSTIVACLLGLGYDVLLDLSHNGTLCGVDISDVLHQGETTGFVEIKLNLDSFRELKAKYGCELKVRRTFREDVPLTDSTFTIEYGGDDDIKSEQLTHMELKTLITGIIPSCVSRFMVLNFENVQFLADNFNLCNEVFWKLTASHKKELQGRLKTMTRQIQVYDSDLESRDKRITYLVEAVRKRDETVPVPATRLKELRSMHKRELKKAKVLHDSVKEIRDTLAHERTRLNSETSDYIIQLIDTMRGPFRKFLQSRQHMGDLLLGDSSQELIIWIQPNHSPSSPQQSNTAVSIEQARQIWRSSTRGRRQLAIMGFYVALWQIQDCCPVVFADIYSSSELEFKCPPAALNILMEVIQGQCGGMGRQFFVSLP